MMDPAAVIREDSLVGRAATSASSAHECEVGAAATESSSASEQRDVINSAVVMEHPAAILVAPIDGSHMSFAPLCPRAPEVAERRRNS